MTESGHGREHENGSGRELLMTALAQEFADESGVIDARRFFEEFIQRLQDSPIPDRDRAGENLVVGFDMIESSLPYSMIRLTVAGLDSARSYGELTLRHEHDVEIPLDPEYINNGFPEWLSAELEVALTGWKALTPERKALLAEIVDLGFGWGCNYCEAMFGTFEAAERHENRCPERPDAP